MDLMARLGILSILLLQLIGTVSAKKAGPDVVETPFTGQLSNLFYFDQSEVVLVRNDATDAIHRSTSAGDSWEQVKDIPEGEVFQIIKHPNHNKVAVALGRRTVHWITDDRGETWRSFKTEDGPALSSFKSPLSFHATDKDRILFQSEACDLFECQEKVSREYRFESSSTDSLIERPGTPKMASRR